MSGMTIEMVNGVPELRNYADKPIALGTLSKQKLWPDYIGSGGWVAGINSNAGRITDIDGKTVLKIFYSYKSQKYRYMSFVLSPELMRDSIMGYFKSGMRMYQTNQSNIIVKYTGNPAQMTKICTPIMLNPAVMQVIAVLQQARINDDVRGCIIRKMLHIECVLV